MHLPDGFISLPASLVAASGAATGVYWAARRLRAPNKQNVEKPTHRFLADEKSYDAPIPKMSVLAAFIFAAQLFNFPVMGGTSGHLMGSALATILLGLAPAIIIMTCVLIVQCLVFQDGGVLALGANVLNMAVLGPLSCYFCYSLIQKFNKRIAAFAGGFVSVLVAAAACALELSLSRVAQPAKIFGAMLFIHAIIGLVEGAITMFVAELVSKGQTLATSRAPSLAHDR